MDKEDVVKYLWDISNKDEIHELFGILRGRNRELEEQIATSFQVGDPVQFTSKYGTVVTGTVAKRNQKTIKVKTDQGMWKVSPSLLEKL